MPTDVDAWLRRSTPVPGAATRLLVLPHAGGTANFYAPLARALAPAVEVVAVQYPGRQDRHRERPLPTITAFADRLFDVVSTMDDMPLAVFGHSMGAVIGYELAQRFRSAGASAPVHLFVSGRRAPSCDRDESVHLRDDAGIIAELRRLSGTDIDVLTDPEVIQLAMPAVRADYRAIETYRHGHGTALDCPVTVLTGDADPLVTLAEAQAWRQHSTAPVELHVLPGGHFFVVDQAPAVIRLLGESLLSAARA
jgi:surfactin synthase thioesterase subunit